MAAAAFIGTLAALLPATASAATIFSNFGPSLAYDTSEGNPVGNDFVGDNVAQGNSFTPLSTASFGSAELALSCFAGCPAASNFTIALAADSSDSPGSVIESFTFTGRTLGALGNNNPPIMATSLLHPTLSAGTRYWITVSSSLSYSIAWNLNSTGDIRDEAISSDGGASWFAPSGVTPGALEVDSFASSTTPEPSFGILVGAGLLVVWSWKRLRLRGSNQN